MRAPLLALTVLFLAPVLASPSHGAAALVSSFGFLRPAVVTNGGSDLVDYPVLIVLDTASLIAAGKMRADCGDVRFTELAAGGVASQPAPYWLERGCNATSTRFWVKLAEIPGAPLPKTVLVAYGNPGATGQADVRRVLDLATDFEEGTLDGWSDFATDRTWVPSATCPLAYPSAVLDAASGRPGVSARKGPEQGNVMECFVGLQRTLAVPATLNLVLEADGRASSIYPVSANADVAVFRGPGISGQPITFTCIVCTGNFLDSGWRHLDPVRVPSAGSSQVTFALFLSDGWIADQDMTAWFDNVFVRRVATPEPAATLGPETPQL